MSEMIVRMGSSLIRDVRAGKAVSRASLRRMALLTYAAGVLMRIEIEREEDGRWLTEIPDLPGVMAYGQTQVEAVAKVKALALRVLADRLEHGEAIPELMDVFSVAA
jgi:predicted RNase H-like HicB family nuclease